MTHKAALMTVTLVMVLGVALSSCSQDDGAPTGSSETSENGQATGDGDATADPSASATSSTDPQTDASDEPKPTVGEVGVLISNSEWDATAGMIVRGYANTVDSEATCTLDLTQGETTRSVESEALASATTMSCGELAVAPADLTSGDWTAVLSYESETAWGTSAPVVVTVP